VAAFRGIVRLSANQIYAEKCLLRHDGVSLGLKDLRIGSVVIDCVNFESMVSFWQGALHYTPRPNGGEDFVVLRDPARENTSVSLNRVNPDEKLSGRNWIHFDLYTENQRAEVERLVALGAKGHAQQYEPLDDFIVLEDPDGNLFCVVDATWKKVSDDELTAYLQSGWEIKGRLEDGTAVTGRSVNSA
jgi:hypothetical protein